MVNDPMKGWGVLRHIPTPTNDWHGDLAYFDGWYSKKEAVKIYKDWRKRYPAAWAVDVVSYVGVAKADTKMRIDLNKMGIHT